MTEINKQEIQRKIKELQQKIAKGEINEVKPEAYSIETSPKTNKINSFYVLEPKPLILAISLSILILAGLYILETHTPYISQLTLWLFDLIS